MSAQHRGEGGGGRWGEKRVRSGALGLRKKKNIGNFHYRRVMLETSRRLHKTWENRQWTACVSSLEIFA